jgi:hypothetical protein
MTTCGCFQFRDEIEATAECYRADVDGAADRIARHAREHGAETVAALERLVGPLPRESRALTDEDGLALIRELTHEPNPEAD